MTIGDARHWSRVIVALSLWCATATPVLAQTSADLFDPQAVHEIRLFINSRDYRQLREHYLADTYYTADLHWRGVRVRNVGVRNRGVGSRNPTKLGLRIDFDRYTSGQTFVGLQSLILDNIWQDGSMIAERVAMAFFERLGELAPRESYARLYINNVFQGLYTVVESVDVPFLSRTLGEGQGYLFGYQFQRPWHAEYLGDDLQPYKDLFEAETHQLEADSIVYAPIRDFIREVNGPDDAVWRERVEQYVDIPRLVRHVAIEMFLDEIDGFLGYNGVNNFFMYRPAGSNVHRFIAWDKDSVLFNSQSGIFTNADQNVLFRRVLAFPDLRALYLDVLEECARAAVSDGWLANEVERLAALATAPTREDTLKQFSTEAFEGAVEIIRRFAAERPPFVLQEVGRARAVDQ
jgi:spore coat protein CotH